MIFVNSKNTARDLYGHLQRNGYHSPRPPVSRPDWGPCCGRLSWVLETSIALHPLLAQPAHRTLYEGLPPVRTGVLAAAGSLESLRAPFPPSSVPLGEGWGGVGGWVGPARSPGSALAVVHGGRCPHRINSLHADITQSERQLGLKHMRKDPTSILVATDLGARGMPVCRQRRAITMPMSTKFIIC